MLEALRLLDSRMPLVVAKLVYLGSRLRVECRSLDANGCTLVPALTGESSSELQDSDARQRIWFFGVSTGCLVFTWKVCITSLALVGWLWLSARSSMHPIAVPMTPLVLSNLGYGWTSLK